MFEQPLVPSRLKGFRHFAQCRLKKKSGYCHFFTFLFDSYHFSVELTQCLKEMKEVQNLIISNRWVLLFSCVCVCVQAALTLSCLCAPVPLYCLEVDNTQTRACVCAGWSVWSPFLQTMQQAHPVDVKDNQMVHNGPHTDDASHRLG